MYRNPAVAYDESPEAKRALDSALRLVKVLGVGLHIVTVMEKLPAYTAYASSAGPAFAATLAADRKLFYEELQAGAAATAASQGVEARLHLLEGDTVESIVACICREKIDLLIVGLHRRQNPVTRLWSTVYTIAQNVPCSVLGVH